MADDPRPLPSRVTMPLLTLITQQSLDEDYREAAQRRARAEADRPAAATDAGPPSGPPGQPRVRHGLSAVAIALFGVLVAIAAVQTSRNADVEDASRNTLITRIDAEREGLAEQQQRIAALRETNTGLQRQLNSVVSDEQAAVGRLRRLQVATGFIPVTGPGVAITVDDPPGGDPQLAVRADNLSWLVDGLWLAGAEAIAVNGQRLTARSALTQSSTALNLNGNPLSAPYVVRAIGDPDVLQSRLVETGPGALFLDAVNTFGFGFGMQNVDALVLPAAPDRLRRLDHAENPRSGPGPQQPPQEGMP